MSERRDRDDIEANESQPLLSNAVEYPLVEHTTPLNDIRTILVHSYIDVLLIFLPFALISGALDWSPKVVFVTNFFAIIPLASLLSFATEELSRTVGQGIGGLLNVTFGNATELIIGIVSIRNGQVRLIQTTMLGSILSSLLFVFLFSFPFRSRSLVGTWTNIRGWWNTNCRIYFQQYDRTDIELVHVRCNRRFNPACRL